MSKSIVLHKMLDEHIIISMGNCSMFTAVNSEDQDYTFMDKILEGNGFMKVSTRHKSYNPLLRIFYDQ